jgi:hypothetical protein
MWVSTTGVTSTWTNSRSCAKGSGGNGVNIAWHQGFLTGQSSGPTHLGMAAYINNEEINLRDRIHLGRIYGQAGIFGNAPLQDYVFLQRTELSTTSHKFQMRV